MNIPAVTLIAASLALGACATDSGRRGGQWSYNGRSYNSYQACQDAKHRSRNRGAVVGAVAAGGVAAATGGSLGQSALAAGVGAVAGGVVGNSMKKC